jgi:antitoxin component YwqK of YwqJK toxin-antitoxin module
MYTGEYTYGKDYVVRSCTYLDPEKKILHGLQRRFYENGNVEKEENYTNGLLDGVTKMYSEDGKILSIRHYSLGEFTSGCDYHENGNVELSENIMDSGYETKIYRKNGTLLRHDLCVDGVRTVTHFYENGKVEMINAPIKPTSRVWNRPNMTKVDHW